MLFKQTYIAVEQTMPRLPRLLIPPEDIELLGEIACSPIGGIFTATWNGAGGGQLVAIKQVLFKLNICYN